MRCAVLSVLVAIVPCVLGQATHTVMVGVKGSFYDPPTNSALEGDIIQFIFGGVFHGVTQSSFENPCMPLEGGFGSGLQGTMGNLSLTTNPPVWNLKITNASAPVWFYCQATQPENHCAQGMVGAVNAPSDMFTNFTSAAKAFVPGPTLPPIVTALTGIGASATALPAPTGVTSSSGSSTTASPSTSSLTADTPSSTTSESSKNSTSVGVIAGAAGGGAAAVAIIGLLLFLLLRKKKSTPPATYVETSERVHFPGTKPGWSSPEPDLPVLRNKPSIMTFDPSGRQISRQGSRNALDDPGLGRTGSYTTSSDRSSTEPLVMSERERANQLRYENSRGDMHSLTMADALTSHPYAHAFAPALMPHVPEQPEPSRERDPVLERGPDVNVHELAKEVAAILVPQNSQPPPSNQQLTAVPSLRAPHARPQKNLPNPRGLNFGHGIRSPEPDASLPQYER